MRTTSRGVGRMALVMSLLVIVEALLGAQCVPPPSGVVGWWSGDGTTAGYAGSTPCTLVNGAGYATGRVGQSFCLDGRNDYVDLGVINVGRRFSVEFWMNATVNNGFQHLVSGYYRSTGFGAIYFAGDHIEFYQGGVARAQSPINSIGPRVWHHVALTYDEVTIRLYVDGVERDARPLAPFVFNDPIRIGSSTPHESLYYGGRLDEVSIYRGALSATQIAAIYNAGAAGKCWVRRPPTNQLSIAAPVTHRFFFDIGSANGLLNYVAAGSLSGDSPGFTVGTTTVPLNPDGYFYYTVTIPNAPPLGNSVGRLDARGRTQTAFTTDPVLMAPLVGLTVHHALVAYDPSGLRAASPAVPIRFVP